MALIILGFLTIPYAVIAYVLHSIFPTLRLIWVILLTSVIYFFSLVVIHLVFGSLIPKDA